jgi:hypothetical protein
MFIPLKYNQVELTRQLISVYDQVLQVQEKLLYLNPKLKEPIRNETSPLPNRKNL